MNNLLENYYGIDFGTTCSAMVNNRLDDKKNVEILQYHDGDGHPIPSVVAIDKKTGKVYTGRVAWNMKNELNDSCEVFSSIKTIIDQERSIYIAGKYWTPIDIACEIFKALKDEVKKTSKGELKEATVAIPVGFSPKKRRSLREAAEKAGINIVSFISEPTAAFFANYNELKTASNVAVFDWGGGTLDVSVLQNNNGRIIELATGGQSIAGDAIDDKIARRIFAKVARKYEIHISFDELDAKMKDKLIMEAEASKRELSEYDDADITIRNFPGIETGIYETIDYEWFADIVAPEINMAINCLERTIKQSGVNLANIDRILLVGGSSNLRPLLEIMDEKYGEKLYCPEKTEWSIGEGAAKLMATPGEYYSAQKIGIILANKVICDDETKEWTLQEGYFEMLGKGEKLKDWKKTFHFGIVDTSKEAQFVFYGSDDIDKMSEKYKTLSVPAYSFLQEHIVTETHVDENRIFTVMAYSSMRPKEKSVIWEYDQLKCEYVLPKV